MRLMIVCLVGLLGMGCALSGIEMIDGNGNPITIKHKIGGRGCIAVTTMAGEVDAIVQQDGSSDWSGIRVIPTLARTAMAVFFGRVGEKDPYTGPSDIQGCAGLFGSQMTGEEGETVVYELLPTE